MIGALVALAIALLFPAEGFVLGFFVLGPLHYLTELSWLYDRGFFLSERRVWPVLAGLAAVGAAVAQLPAGLWVQAVAVGVMVAAVVGAGWGVLVGRWSVPITGLALAAGIGLMYTPLAEGVFEAFGVWIPTLVHVLVLNVGFMVHGVLTRRQREDVHALLAVVAGLGVVLWVDLPTPPVGSAFAETLGFLHGRLVDLGLGEGPATRLIAFAYLHHFLNWFQKTERIGWLRMPDPRKAVILVLWLGLVALAAVDLRLALAVGLLPNLAHVVMELPLNWRTMHAFRALASA